MGSKIIFKNNKNLVDKSNYLLYLYFKFLENEKHNIRN